MFVDALQFCLSLPSHSTTPDISESGDEIIYKNFVDISVAVATPSGLLVPVLRDCHRKSIAEIESDLVALAQKGREGKMALEEMVGGTFTISNGEGRRFLLAYRDVVVRREGFK